MTIIAVSVGDKNHDPTLEEIEKVKKTVSEAVDDKYSIMVYPYYVNVRMLLEEELEKIGLKEKQIEKIEDKLSGVKARTEIRVE